LKRGKLVDADSSQDRRVPNVLLIGAAKSGTTSLHDILGQHPEIYMSTLKEPGFFASSQLSQPMNGPGDTRQQARACLDLKSYLALFGGTGGTPIVGESSTIYLYSEGAASSIAEFNPEMKIVAILRNPIDRAYSHYCQRSSSGEEPLPSFEQAIRAEPRRINDGWHPIWHYIRRGLYAEQLKRYLSIFDSRNIRVYLFEDFVSEPEAMVMDLYRFLGVDEAFRPNTNRRLNATPHLPRISLLNRMMTQRTAVTAALKRVVNERLLSATSQVMRRWNRKPRPTVDQRTRIELIKYYRDDVIELQRLIDRDLKAWLVVN